MINTIANLKIVNPGSKCSKCNKCTGSAGSAGSAANAAKAANNLLFCLFWLFLLFAYFALGLINGFLSVHVRYIVRLWLPHFDDFKLVNLHI
jgi:hypothetical protein